MIDIKEAAQNEAPRIAQVYQNGQPIGYVHNSPPVLHITAQHLELNADELSDLQTLVEYIAYV
jgi:hypothetical protein